VLLAAGADVHTRDDFALRWASANGHVEVVKVLLATGADVHARDDDALQLASANGHVEVVKVLNQWIKKEKKKVNESIKHLKPRSFKEIEKILPEHIKKFTKFILSKGGKIKNIDSFLGGFSIDFSAPFKYSDRADYTAYIYKNQQASLYASNLGYSKIKVDTLDDIIKYIENNTLHESIKHLQPRSKEEIEKNLSENVIKLIRFLERNNILYKFLQFSPETTRITFKWKDAYDYGVYIHPKTCSIYSHNVFKASIKPLAKGKDIEPIIQYLKSLVGKKYVNESGKNVIL
jgi:hypothetical protein